MLLYAEALSRLLEEARKRGLLPSEEVPLGQAPGRVAAQRLLSRESLPAFDNSAMDGYALKAELTAAASREHPLVLPILGSLSAGERAIGRGSAASEVRWRAAERAIGRGGVTEPIGEGMPPPRVVRTRPAFEIMTGAPIPRGCDAVVKVEEVRRLRQGRAIQIISPARAGDYVRRAGADLEAGTVLWEPGTRLEPHHVLALAALGFSRTPVRRRPRVALISTGRELVAPRREPKPGQIRNASAAYLCCALPRCKALARSFGNCPDEPVDFRRRLRLALAWAPDVVLTTGAVSMGRHDFVAGELSGLGARLLFHKAAVRPGKPVLAAVLRGGPLLLGLPGNPISTVVGLRFFLWPYLERLLGLSPEAPRRARLCAGTSKPEGLRCFYKARLRAGPRGLEAEVLPGQASFQLRPLLAANAWAVLPEKGERLEAGREVDSWPLLPSGEELP